MLSMIFVYNSLTAKECFKFMIELTGSSSSVPLISWFLKYNSYKTVSYCTKIKSGIMLECPYFAHKDKKIN